MDRGEYEKALALFERARSEPDTKWSTSHKQTCSEKMEELRPKAEEQRAAREQLEAEQRRAKKQLEADQLAAEQLAAEKLAAEQRYQLEAEQRYQKRLCAALIIASLLVIMAAVKITLARLNSKVMGWRKVILAVLVLVSMLAITFAVLVSLVMISVRRRSLISKPCASLPKSVVASNIKKYQELRMMVIKYGAEAKNDYLALTLSYHGRVYMSIGNYEEACNKYTQSVEIFWNIYGPDAKRFRLAEALSNLGASQMYNGDYKEACVNLEQALAMTRNVFGASTKNASLAKTLCNLGELHRNLHHYDEAHGKLDEALCMFQQVYGDTNEEDHNYPRALHNLGRLYHDLGKYTQAGVKYDEAIQMYQRLHGSEPRMADHVRALQNLAMLQIDELRRKQMVASFVLMCLFVVWIVVVTTFRRWGWFNQSDVISHDVTWRRKKLDTEDMGWRIALAVLATVSLVATIVPLRGRSRNHKMGLSKRKNE